MQELKKCPFCALPGKFLMVIDDDERNIFVEVSDSVLRVFDDIMPGMLEGRIINFCPMCGRYLGRADDGGEGVSE